MPFVLGELDATRMGGLELTKSDKFYVVNSKGEKSFYVLGDSLDDEKDDIIVATGIPQIWSNNPDGICRGLDAKETGRVRSPLTGQPVGLWEVTARFDSTLDPSQQDEQNTPPEARTPKWRWTTEVEEETLDKDPVTGLPIETAAKEKIVTTKPVRIAVLTISRYENFPFDPNILYQYLDRANSHPFWGAPVGTAMMNGIDADEEILQYQDQSTRYAKVDYVIHFKLKSDPDNPGQLLEDTWMGEVLHQGHLYRDEDTMEIKRAVDSENRPILVNLTEEGFRLTDDAPPEAASYIRFNRSTKVNFNTLNLGPFV